MAGIKVRINTKGVLDVLNSDGVRSDIQRRVDAIKARANSLHTADGYEGDVMTTDRPHGAVWAGDLHSRRSNARYNTLLKALDAGRE